MIKLNKNMFNSIELHDQKTYDSIGDFQNDFATFRGYTVHIGYMIFGGQNSFFIGFLQSYLNGYAKVLVLGTWSNYILQLNNGTWTITNLTTS